MKSGVEKTSGSGEVIHSEQEKQTGVHCQSSGGHGEEVSMGCENTQHKPKMTILNVYRDISLSKALYLYEMNVAYCKPIIFPLGANQRFD